MMRPTLIAGAKVVGGLAIFAGAYHGIEHMRRGFDKTRRLERNAIEPGTHVAIIQNYCDALEGDLLFVGRRRGGRPHEFAIVPKDASQYPLISSVPECISEGVMPHVFATGKGANLVEFALSSSDAFVDSALCVGFKQDVVAIMPIPELEKYDVPTEYDTDPWFIRGEFEGYDSLDQWLRSQKRCREEDIQRNVDRERRHN